MYIEEKKGIFFSPEIPESWLSKPLPGYFESRFCEKEQLLVWGRASEISIRFTPLHQLRVEAFTDKQIQTAFQY